MSFAFEKSVPKILTAAFLSLPPVGQVIEADPNAAESWASLGVVMAELGQTEAALACQKQVCPLFSSDMGGADEDQLTTDFLSLSLSLSFIHFFFSFFFSFWGGV